MQYEEIQAIDIREVGYGQSPSIVNSCQDEIVEVKIKSSAEQNYAHFWY